MADTRYEEFVRTRITELRINKNVSEHKMSLELGKSGSYIRGITSGMALPSLREFFNIVSYLGVTPAEFFATMEEEDTPARQLCNRLKDVDETDLTKINTFIDWITK